jgi:hypothetical protein
MQSTFAAYYITTFTLNTVAIVAGILSQFDFHYSQHNNHFNRVDSWYMANGVFGVLHILAAIYIVYRIEKPLSSTKASGFDYRLDNEAPPPPHSPKHIQAHEVVVVHTHGSSPEGILPVLSSSTATQGCHRAVILASDQAYHDGRQSCRLLHSRLFHLPGLALLHGLLSHQLLVLPRNAICHEMCRYLYCRWPGLLYLQCHLHPGNQKRLVERTSRSKTRQPKDVSMKTPNNL